MTKHCSFSMISESRAGSSKKSKSRYDCLPGSRAAAWTSFQEQGVERRKERGGEKEREKRETCRSFGNFSYPIFT